MAANAKVLLIFPHYEQDDITYFSYHKPGTSPADRTMSNENVERVQPLAFGGRHRAAL